jgi:hypothetical protein
VTARKKALGGTVLDRAAILGADDLPRERVACPEWGGDVFVRTLTALDRDAWEQETYTARQAAGRIGKSVNVRASLCARVICDAAGARVFSDEDIAALGAKSGRVLDRLFEVAQRLNGIGVADVEELEKN